LVKPLDMQINRVCNSTPSVEWLIFECGGHNNREQETISKNNEKRQL
jgi:hypothetical protein